MTEQINLSILQEHIQVLGNKEQIILKPLVIIMKQLRCTQKIAQKIISEWMIRGQVSFATELIDGFILTGKLENKNPWNIIKILDKRYFVKKEIRQNSRTIQTDSTINIVPEKPPEVTKEHPPIKDNRREAVPSSKNRRRAIFPNKQYPIAEIFLQLKKRSKNITGRTLLRGGVPLISTQFKINLYISEKILEYLMECKGLYSVDGLRLVEINENFDIRVLDLPKSQRQKGKKKSRKKQNTKTLIEHDLGILQKELRDIREHYQGEKIDELEEEQIQRIEEFLNDLKKRKKG